MDNRVWLGTMPQDPMRRGMGAIRLITQSSTDQELGARAKSVPLDAPF
jgi:hypothetical protein